MLLFSLVLVVVVGLCGVDAQNFIDPSYYTSGKSLVTPAQYEALKNAQTVVDRFALLSEGATTFDYYTATTQVENSPGGKKIMANTKNWPGIIGLGMSTIYLNLAPCGLNLPHFHPRATTITTVLSGTIMTGYFMENGEHYRIQNVTKGMSTIIPQGALHFEQNLGCTPVEFVAHFNAEDPGTQTVVPAFFSLPAQVDAVALGGLSSSAFQSVKASATDKLVLGIQECRARCNV